MDDGSASVQGSTRSTRDEGLPQYGGMIVVRFRKVNVRSKQGRNGSYVFKPRVEVCGSEKKTDGMHVETGTSNVSDHPSNLSICEWKEPICEVAVFYASDFQLTVAKVKKSGVEMPSADTWRLGPKTAERRERKRRKQEMEKEKEGKDKLNPIEL